MDEVVEEFVGLLKDPPQDAALRVETMQLLFLQLNQLPQADRLSAIKSIARALVEDYDRMTPEERREFERILDLPVLTDALKKPN